MDGIQKEVPEVQEESSWEVQSSVSSSDEFSESSQESSDESSGDEDVPDRKRRQTALPQHRI